VAEYLFDGNTNDTSGNGNNGTNNGVTFTDNKFGVSNAAASFNGRTSFIETPSSPSLNLTN